MKKVVKWLLIASAAVFILCFLALLIIPRFVDLEDYRPQIESKVSEATGRPFTLGGDLARRDDRGLGVCGGPRCAAGGVGFRQRQTQHSGPQ